jgi:hypothetical protein
LPSGSTSTSRAPLIAPGAQLKVFFAVARERGVQRAVRVQARDGGPHARASREHDLAIGLQRRAEGGLTEAVAAEADHPLPARPERGVEHAVAAQPRHTKAVRGRATPGDDDPPVRLYQHDVRRVDTAEIDRLFPVAGKARIEITGASHAPTIPPHGPPPHR